MKVTNTHLHNFQNQRIIDLTPKHRLHTPKVSPADQSHKIVKGIVETEISDLSIKDPRTGEVRNIDGKMLKINVEQHYHTKTIDKYESQLTALGESNIHEMIYTDDKLVGVVTDNQQTVWFDEQMEKHLEHGLTLEEVSAYIGTKISFEPNINADFHYSDAFSIAHGVEYADYVKQQVQDYKLSAVRLDQSVLGRSFSYDSLGSELSKLFDDHNAEVLEYKTRIEELGEVNIENVYKVRGVIVGAISQEGNEHWFRSNLPVDDNHIASASELADKYGDQFAIESHLETFSDLYSLATGINFKSYVDLMTEQYRLAKVRRSPL